MRLERARKLSAVGTVVGALVWGGSVLRADTFSFSTGNPDGLMAAASRPDSAGKIEIETGDDFVTPVTTLINSATFTGLLTGGSPQVTDVVVEIYRVFPLDSDTGRTPAVLTRANSPSDVAFDSRDSAAGGLTFSTQVLSSVFTAQNSVINGISKAPNQTTGGDGPVAGQEAQFTVNFATPFDLPAGHYFFVPQVQVGGTGQFFWLSAARPIVPPGTPFPGGQTDLQAWIRNENLDPDWSRIGTDIVGGTTPPTFNMAFSLQGIETPLPGGVGLACAAVGMMGVGQWWGRGEKKDEG